MLLREEQGQLDRLIENETAIEDAVNELLQDRTIFDTQTGLELNNTSTKYMRFVSYKYAYPDGLGLSILRYMANKFGKGNGTQLYPLAPTGVLGILKEFLGEFEGTEASLLEGLEFYFDHLLECETIKGRLVYPYAKKLKNILVDKQLLNILLIKLPKFNVHNIL